MQPKWRFAGLAVGQEDYDEKALLSEFGYCCGPLEFACDKCGALFWLDERLSNSSKIKPKFSMCCRNGKVVLPPYPEPPQPLPDLLTRETTEARNFRSVSISFIVMLLVVCPLVSCLGKKPQWLFRKKIRMFNSVLAFTSVGVKMANTPGFNPTYKISGELVHRCVPVINRTYVVTEMVKQTLCR